MAQEEKEQAPNLTDSDSGPESDEEAEEDGCGDTDDEKADAPPPGGPVVWESTTFEEQKGDMRQWRPPETLPAPENTGATGFGTRHYDPTPGNVFRAFVPDTMLAQFATASTAYAASEAAIKASRSSARVSSPIQGERPEQMSGSNVYVPDDILDFILCSFAMGIVQLPRVRQYWHGALKQPYVRRIMTYARYVALCKHLHWINTAAVSAQEQATRAKEDGFWKLGDFVPLLSGLFQRLRVSRRNLTLDEFTIPLRGRHRCKCFNPNKPCRYHLKGYSLNEAETGYCLCFFMYQGRDEKRPAGVTATTWPTLKLIGGYKALHNKNYILWADNWFSGLPAIQVCVDNGLDYVGTARANRLGGAFKGAADAKKWDRGKYRAEKAQVGGKDVWAIQWKDSKLVSVLSTIESVVGTTKRKMVDKKTKEYTNNAITIPAIYSAYNFGKVGTDRMDQQVGVYYKNRRLRWPVKTVVHLMYITLTNAHVSYRSLKEAHMPLLEYIMALIDELKPAGKDSGLAQAHLHTPTTGDLKKRKKSEAAKPADRNRGNRGKCFMCKSSVSTRCMECNKWLHIPCYGRTKDCWTEWHTRNANESD